MSHVRWLLWGAPRPAPQERGRLLLGYGAVAWAFSVLFIDVLFVGLCRWLGGRWGWTGVAGGMFLGCLVLQRLFQGFCAGEFKQMLSKRPTRTKLWIGGVAALLAALCIGRAEDRTGGNFQIRPNTKADLRAG